LLNVVKMTEQIHFGMADRAIDRSVLCAPKC
jgi:hypothetical protein